MNKEHYNDRTAEMAVGRASKPSNPKLSAAIRAVKIVLHRYGFDIEKLKLRYPDGFSAERSRGRDK